MKKIIIVFISLFVLFLTGCDSTTNLTNEEFQNILNEVTFDSSESKVEFCMKSSNGNDLIFTYIISEKESYIKTIKEINGVVETNVIFALNGIYYLYQDVDGDNTTLEITEEKQKEFFDKVITDQENYYSNMKSENAENIIKNNNTITFNETINDIFYENTLTLDDNNLVELRKVFTKNNSVNTVTFKVEENFEIEIPGGNV